MGAQSTAVPEARGELANAEAHTPSPHAGADSAPPDIPSEDLELIEEKLEKSERRIFIGGTVVVVIAGVTLIALAIFKYAWDQEEWGIPAWTALQTGISADVLGHAMNVAMIALDGAAKATFFFSVAITLILRVNVRNVIRRVFRVNRDTRKITETKPIYFDAATGDWLRQMTEIGLRERITELEKALADKDVQADEQIRSLIDRLIGMVRTLRSDAAEQPGTEGGANQPST